MCVHVTSPSLSKRPSFFFLADMSLTVHASTTELTPCRLFRRTADIKSMLFLVTTCGSTDGIMCMILTYMHARFGFEVIVTVSTAVGIAFRRKSVIFIRFYEFWAAVLQEVLLPLEQAADAAAEAELLSLFQHYFFLCLCSFLLAVQHRCRPSQRLMEPRQCSGKITTCVVVAHTLSPFVDCLAHDEVCLSCHVDILCNTSTCLASCSPQPDLFHVFLELMQVTT